MTVRYFGFVSVKNSIGEGAAFFYGKILSFSTTQPTWQFLFSRIDNDGE